MYSQSSHHVVEPVVVQNSDLSHLEIDFSKWSVILAHKYIPISSFMLFQAITIAGLSSIMSDLLNENDDYNLLYCLFIVLLILGFTFQTWYSVSNQKENYKRLASDQVASRHMDADGGLLAMLVTEAENQEAAECMLSYYLLLQNGRQTVRELKRSAELIVKKHFDVEIDFDVDDAIRKLTHLKLLVPSSVPSNPLAFPNLTDSSSIEVVSLEEAVKSVRSHLIKIQQKCSFRDQSKLAGQDSICSVYEKS